MRICMLAANPLRYDGRALRHAGALIQAGHSVTQLGVIGPLDDPRPPPQPAFAYWRLDRRRRGVAPRLVGAVTALRQRAAERLCGLVSDATLQRWPGLAELSVSTSALELCAKALSIPADLIYANDLTTLPAGAWAARLRGVPCVYDARELYTDEEPDLTPVQRRCRQAAERRLIRGAAVVTINDLVADELVRLYGIPRPLVVRNVPPLQDVELPRAPAAPGALRLLYQSANLGLCQPGTDDVLRAMARVRDQLSIHLTLRGNIAAHHRDALLRRAQALGIAPLITLRPAVSGVEELVRLAASGGHELGLAVHPPLSRQYVFTTSGKVFEYQMAGLGVCATDLLGNRASVDSEAGVFYPPGDDQRLAEIFLLLGRDKARLLAMRQAARRRAERELCWEREGPPLVDLCDRLCDRLCVRQRERQRERQRPDPILR